MVLQKDKQFKVSLLLFKLERWVLKKPWELKLTKFLPNSAMFLCKAVADTLKILQSLSRPTYQWNLVLPEVSFDYEECITNILFAKTLIRYLWHKKMKHNSHLCVELSKAINMCILFPHLNYLEIYESYRKYSLFLIFHIKNTYYLKCISTPQRAAVKVFLAPLNDLWSCREMNFDELFISICLSIWFTWHIAGSYL